VRKLLPGELRRFAKATRTNIDDLIKEVALVRERGYATDLEEFEEGLRCIGAPCATIPARWSARSASPVLRTGLPTRGSPPWSARSSIGREGSLGAPRFPRIAGAFFPKVLALTRP